MKTYRGTATLLITKMDSKWVPFQVDVEDYEDQDPKAHDFIHEEFSLLDTDTLANPDAAYDLKVGESVRVEVDYEFTYTTDYYGEVDCELEYTRQQVIEPERGIWVVIGIIVFGAIVLTALKIFLT